MKRIGIALVSLVALAGFAQSAAAAQASAKIGVVNIQALLQESPQARAATSALQSEFGPVQREIDALRQSLASREEQLNKDRATMSPAQINAVERELRDGYIDLQAKQEKAEDRLNTRRNEEMMKLNRAVLEEVQKYAQANGFDLILADGVLFATAALDITGPVLQALQARAGGTGGATAPAPAPSNP
ncbi:MAG: OmpH family outer membrane protein [Pseudomonadota bacterium]|nr:MAG: molecular chaperone Skp [Pseudomonadota bacterium]